MPLQDVLTPRRVHLLGGVSDAGKTRFILPALLAWATAPPWVYVVGDRTLEDAQDSMRDMGIAPANVPTIPAFGEHNRATWLEVKLAVDKWAPQAELIVVEGFQDLCPGQGRKNEVREFLSGVSSYLNPSLQHPNGITILGVVESPKLKPHEVYPNPRQRVSGVSAWGYHASTIMLVESAAKDESFAQPQRILWICHKAQARRKVDGCFDSNNRLIFPSL
jgi:hypothetical protein